MIEKGRQAAVYWKFKLMVSSKFKFDVYLIKIPKGVTIPPHQDPAPSGFIHRRINLLLNRKPRYGGVLYHQDGFDTKASTRYVHFSPSEQWHWMSPPSSNIYILSIGYLKKVDHEKVQ